MIPPHLTRPQQVTTAESSPTTVRHRRRSADLDVADPVGTRSRAAAAGGRTQPVLNVGNKLGSWLDSGRQSTRHEQARCGGTPTRRCQTARHGRRSFGRYVRSLTTVARRNVSALNKLHVSSGLPTLLIWGDQDRIIPVAHGYATHAAVPGSRLEVLPGVGHFPHVESPPTAVVHP